jgi:DNA-binding winged helix-turn-helix (wHTH) protein/TolB-like protein
MRGFEFGPWNVLPERGLIRDGETEKKLEPLVMDVFVVLVSHDGDVVSRDQLIDAVWEGRPQMDDVINRCITSLRKALGDDARSPIYIETVPRRGYRVKLSAVLPEPAAASVPEARRTTWPIPWLLVAGAIAAIIVAWQTLKPKPPADEVNSVAVFQFECIQTADQSRGHLCFGFAEEAITSLQQVGGLLTVRKRMPFTGDQTSAEDALVSGSVQIIGDDVKVSARLERSQSGLVLWSDTYDAEISEVFDLHTLVADGIRAALDPGFNAAANSVRQPDGDDAKAAYSVARQLFRQRDHDRVSDAIRLFNEVIELDPGFGPAWLGLGYMYVLWPDYDLEIDRLLTYDEAIRLMERGIAADPSIRDKAGTIFGFIYHKRNQWAEALEMTGRAVSANSANADDFNWHSRVLASVGRMDEALDYARKGLEIDPEYLPVAVSRMAIASLWVNDLENAARYFELANSMDLQASVHLLAYSLYLMRNGQVEVAKTYAKAGLERNGVDSRWVDPVLDGIANSQDRPQALAIMNQLSESGVLPANVEMTMWVLLDEIDRAMEIARMTEAEGGQFEQEIIFIDEYKAFRQHPEFMDFIEGIGLQDYWDSAGCVWAEDKLTCS